MCLLCAGAGARAAVVRASSAGAFVDSIGVNTHLFYTDTAYRNYPRVRDRLRELGVKHIRDGLPPGRQDLYHRLNDLAAYGIRSTLIYNPSSGSVSQFVSDLSRVRSSADSVEGANELDATGGNWAARDRAYQQDLFKSTKAFDASLRVVSPSLVSPQAYRELGDVGSWADAGNMHSYPAGEGPSGCKLGRTLADCFSDARLDAPGDPVWATETGYHDALSSPGTYPPSSERAAGIYMSRLPFEYARQGVARWYVYELLDELPDPAGAAQEANFGLLRNDFSPKPAFTALKNSIALLNDKPGAAGSLRYSLTGDLTGVEQTLLVKRDGSFWVALWRRASVWNAQARQDLDPSSRQVTLNLEQPVRSADGYQPLYHSSSEAHFDSPKHIVINLPADLVLVKLTP